MTSRLTSSLFAGTLLVGLSACLPFATAPAQADERIDTSRGPVRVETLAAGLEHPWSIAVMPDGAFLVTERPGRLRHVSAEGSVSDPIAGLPAIAASGQGGLLDIALAPDFEASRVLFLTFAEPRGGGANTALLRARLSSDARALEDVAVIFRAEPGVSGGRHFGSRVVIAPDGESLFVTTGDRGSPDESQNRGSHMGIAARLLLDGTPHPDNPDFGPGAVPGIYAYGLRNTQGAAIHPETGALWSVDMGPRFGDEVNVIRAGANYGWPEVSDGREYSGIPIPDHATRPEFEAPVFVWDQSMAPAGIAFYTGDLFPEWQGDLLVGGLAGMVLARLSIEGERVVSEERIAMDRRIRDVAQAPDGAVLLLEDAPDGAILRLTPAD
ncbi:PQQ-dependent sugar dehydrogenase [Salinarimonas sp.]|uniref:PQQ-dependent sugar dehydrogenase n=1 Tax=Salinarimonas sp. TaxID=2766526 RepID=UPI00391B746C